MRDAIRTEYIRNLEAGRERFAYKGMTGTQAAQYFRDDMDRFEGVQWSDFTKDPRGVFEFYGNTAIAYDFTIESSEMNAAGVDLTLLRKLTRGSDAVGLLAKNDRTRVVRRHFRVFDSFDSLVRRLQRGRCAGVPHLPNAIFPSTGTLRLHSLVKNFTIQNQVGNLGGKDWDYRTAQMDDTMIFTTKSTGNFDPTLSSDATPGVFVPSQIKLTMDNYRQDLHTIIILLQLSEDPSKALRFDQRGLLTAPLQSERRLQLEVGLDRVVDRNAQDAISQALPAFLNRIN
ncbi:hypothetical protein FHR71_005502 [Methylobacterium sp. RAS18]|nr:hypothetical protein [Methylobacterium sp. RAS18]